MGSHDRCWTWQGARTSGGYGTTSIDGKQVYVHRVAYEAWFGPVPAGLQLDHLCRNRDCYNPAHLEPVTCKENLRRSPLTVQAVNAQKTHCKNGHAFTPENTSSRINWTGGISRRCKTCHRDRERARYAATYA